MKAVVSEQTVAKTILMKEGLVTIQMTKEDAQRLIDFIGKIEGECKPNGPMDDVYNALYDAGMRCSRGAAEYVIRHKALR